MGRFGLVLLGACVMVMALCVSVAHGRRGRFRAHSRRTESTPPDEHFMWKEIFDEDTREGLGQNAWKATALDNEAARKVGLEPGKTYALKFQCDVRKECDLMQRAYALDPSSFPNCYYYEPGFEEDERESEPFLVMQLVAGKPLTALLPLRPHRGAPTDLIVSQSFTLLKQLYTLVGQLQSAKISHQDLQPKNILVDEQNHVTIIDFGESNLENPEDKLPINYALDYHDLVQVMATMLLGYPDVESVPAEIVADTLEEGAYFCRMLPALWGQAVPNTAPTKAFDWSGAVYKTLRALYLASHLKTAELLALLAGKEDAPKNAVGCLAQVDDQHVSCLALPQAAESDTTSQCFPLSSKVAAMKEGTLDGRWVDDAEAPKLEVVLTFDISYSHVGFKNANLDSTVPPPKVEGRLNQQRLDAAFIRDKEYRLVKLVLADDAPPKLVFTDADDAQFALIRMDKK